MFRLRKESEVTHDSISPSFKYDVGEFAKFIIQMQKWKSVDDLPDLELKDIRIGKDALFDLPEIFKDNGIKPTMKILLVVDDTEILRANDNLKNRVFEILTLHGYEVNMLVLESDSYGLVHPDFVEVKKVMDAMSDDMAVLSVGSGVITDITKHACYTYKEKSGKDKTLITFMTACSAPAYTSKYSIISKDGVKRTWPSRTPDVIVMDIQTLMDCPYTYTIGGVGDALPAFTAFADWYLAECMGMGKIIETSWRIDEDIRELLLPYASEISSRSEIGMEVLGKCVHLIGLSMSYARDSVAASGYEHVMSHMLDMSANYDKRRTAVHGQQVGITSILTIIHFEKIYEKMEWLYGNKSELDYSHFFPEENDVKSKVLELFHVYDKTDAMGMECWNDMSIKLNKWCNAEEKLKSFVENWPEHKKVLDHYLYKTAQECTNALEVIKHPLYFEELNIPIRTERGKWAMKNANLMRKRFTSADLAFFLGWLDDDWIEDVFQRYELLIKNARQNQ
jgi:glycerol-1-phosphate dehydrogenase [NAD(P)+]